MQTNYINVLFDTRIMWFPTSSQSLSQNILLNGRNQNESLRWPNFYLRYIFVKMNYKNKDFV